MPDRHGFGVGATVVRLQTLMTLDSIAYCRYNSSVFSTGVQAPFRSCGRGVVAWGKYFNQIAVTCRAIYV